ncbi:MAG TPA: peptide chain release factor N(5)-glutamine methyltransferase [Acidimicrobiales bacterium]|nr:peptide chain release factor N(5)-glutamine methyltransferase [Acidimicrobiales bacterium]
MLSRREAQWIAEQASGGDLDVPPTKVAAAHFAVMVERRAAGEPLQYVLGSWGFRELDLWVDGRVLIPRPETEQVVEHALRVAREMLEAVRVVRVVDLGTGSGAIALSIAAELPLGRVEVWATDASEDALAVARANLAGIGRSGSAVRLVAGDWYAALPAGPFHLIVSNPPYVADDEALPPEVAEWEPQSALYAGPTGLEAIEHIVAHAPAWLAPGGALVVEIGETQGEAVLALATAAGFKDAAIHQDLAGRDRILVATR